MRASILFIHGITVLVQAQPQAQVTLEPEPPSCPDYSGYSSTHHEPKSTGRYKLSYQRPHPSCRTFSLPEVEETIVSMKQIIKDPDLFRLFENCFPNTLDTAITWKGLSWKNATSHLPVDINNPEPGQHPPEAQAEELTFITTGDIPAMWLRDSAHQLSSYATLLKPSNSSSSLASLYRGLINLQARYILTAPHCNAFLAPPESGIPPPPSSDDGTTDYVYPPLPSTPGSQTKKAVHECKYELDSLASFLSLSHTYLTSTSDLPFVSRPSSSFLPALRKLLSFTKDLQSGTYNRDGTPAFSAYQFQRFTTTSTETLPNAGSGPPMKTGTGLVRSAFRPSDDATTYQGFIPGNMMFASYLSKLSPLVSKLDKTTGQEMADLAAEIKKGIEDHGRTDHRLHGRIYAYEVDGYGSHNLMDDANIPSLLSAPLYGYLDRNGETYQRTRRFVLGESNPYYMFGPVLNATGGPHIGPGMAWPMGLIVQALTSDDDDEIYSCIKQLLSSTDGFGLMHESVNTHSVSVWTRHWFSWANGLFGQLILDINKRKSHLLAKSYQ
ncbi:hypothetical protein QBC36DRAFT_300811 [Triangularia setosa]|uniref:Uncharacterized protein n=1 Tax=Triangularia setosa TaxID=2587417 RepID=A0AAN6W7W9_9PEZI|nr:hypothetical protein QBC36DRAFT_300811 [Podospora setosa]